MDATIIRGHVAAAYEGLGSRVAELADIRNLCPAVSRQDMDEALIDMHCEGIIALHSQDAPELLTADDQAAALQYGPRAMHRLAWVEFG